MKPLKIILVCAFFFSAKYLCEQETDGFTRLAISSQRPYEERWETRALTAEETDTIQEALDQKYTYFGCGGQAFVCFSADGRYALKFFKQRRFRPPALLNHLPLPSFLHRYRAKKNWSRENKMERDFTSYKMAFEELPCQTGLLYVHLNKTDHLRTTITVIDKLNIEHSFDLDEMDFILQKRAELVYPSIEKWMKNGQTEKAGQAIGAVLKLLEARCQKGIRDRDANISTNCGLVDGRAIKIDVGPFVKDERLKERQNMSDEIARIAKPFRAWVGVFYPELLKRFDEEMRLYVE